MSMASYIKARKSKHHLRVITNVYCFLATTNDERLPRVIDFPRINGGCTRPGSGHPDCGVRAQGDALQLHCSLKL